MKLKGTFSLEESYDKPRQRINEQRHHFANKCSYSQIYGFFSSHVQMWELDHKKGWVLKNWCFHTVVLEKVLESPLDYKEIKPVNPKGNQPLEGLILKLKLQYPGHRVQRAYLPEKILMLGKIEGKRRRERQRTR